MAKDVDLFAAAMVGVAPLKGVKRRSAGTSKSKAPPSGKPSARSADPPAKALVRTAAPRLEPFDRDVDKALARGRRQPEATLDLHGLTLAAAERSVAGFLSSSAERGLRVVLIVTGKGLRLESGRVFGGRIRAEFPLWLERPENRLRVVAARPAHPRHGGSGAYYVLLRRRAVRA